MNEPIEIMIDNEEYFALEKSEFIEFYHFIQAMKHLKEVESGKAKAISTKEYINDRERKYNKKFL